MHFNTQIITTKMSDIFVPIEEPKGTGRLSNLQTLQGATIPAIDRVKLMSANDYEDYVTEWAHGYLNKVYNSVVHLGGSGDKGRDVIGYLDEAKTECHYYQCKHYDEQLTPSSIFIEIGKLIYYTYTGVVILPIKHYFVAPQGEGPALHDLLLKPDDLRTALINNWGDKCESKITSKTKVILNEALLKYINEFDFSLFGSLQPLEMIDQHRQTKYHSGRFGGGLTSSRKIIPTAGNIIEDFELGYTTQLFEVYSEKEGTSITNKADLASNAELNQHFNESRDSFYSAESLRQLSRDNLPNGTDVFEDLKNEVHTTIRNTERMQHGNGYERLLNCTQVAINGQYTSSPLHIEIKAEDKEGTCHHLANENKVKWVK